jgi:hypothetical protein
MKNAHKILIGEPEDKKPLPTKSMYGFIFPMRATCVAHPLHGKEGLSYE